MVAVNSLEEKVERSDQAGGCGDHVRVDVAREAFASVDPAITPLTDAQLQQLASRADQVFKNIAGAMCSAGELSPAKINAVDTLLLLSGSGATEPVLFRDDEQFGAKVLVFQYAFSEMNLKLPERSDIKTGVRCWAEPDHQGCSDRVS